ncbi:hypothetical protein VPNG_10372 [Cytospora leucostoma]|uniref:RRM domain-containing protein n=1 Tax=Cytospora leucostoma TaxID=1230097 RepID=A0A423VBQ7_9PEZI|nr:hypothetical protein VPNG_10372 [Cytospora leucostoma]
MSAFSSSNWRTSDTQRMGEPPHEQWGTRSSSAAGKTGSAWPGRRDRGSGDNRSRRDGPYETTAPHPTWDQAQGFGLERRSRPDTSDTADKIAQGRRIYLGNLLYRVKPKQIEEMLDASGFEGRVGGIHISVDAVTGRNPGYCFIDFEAREDAERALDALCGVMVEGRPVKVGPCRPKGAEKRSGDYKPTFQRWGDWKGSRAARSDGLPDDDERPDQGPYGALHHLDGVRDTGTPARVYVGGLGKMINQEENDKEVRGYLKGFTVFVLSPSTPESG